jgi:hypothetical protein
MSEVTNTNVSLNMKNELEKPNQKSILQIKKKASKSNKANFFFWNFKTSHEF